MDFALTEEQEEITAAFGRFFSERSTPEVVRQAEPTGFDPRMWSDLVSLGVPAVGLPTNEGGASLVDLVLVCELAGRVLAPVPIPETLAFVRGLSGMRDQIDPEAKDTLEDVLAAACDGTIGTLALLPVATGEGRHIVPAGGLAEFALAVVDDSLVLLRGSPDRVQRISTTHGSVPVAKWDLTPRAEDVVLMRGGGGEALAAIRAEWMVLTLASLVGLTDRALEITSEYATSRLAFGSPIGAFQGVAHPLADSATESCGTGLLVRRIAWMIDVQRRSAIDHLTSLAWGFFCPAATRATARCVHIHGGYGSALEYDIQLYHQRARAWSSLLGDPAEYLRFAGETLLERPEEAQAWISI